MTTKNNEMQFERIDVKKGTLAGSSGYLAHSIAASLTIAGERVDVILSAADPESLTLAIDKLLPEMTLKHQPQKTAILAPEAIQPSVADDDDEL